jgi:hypothetical protein
VSKLRTRTTIDVAYARLERATESSTDATRLLRAAFEAALQGEHAHRRMGRHFGAHKYLNTPDTAARYFVCKWFADTTTKVSCALDACMLRGDCLNATALRELLAKDGKTVELEGIADLNYSTDIVGER